MNSILTCCVNLERCNAQAHQRLNSWLQAGGHARACTSRTRDFNLVHECPILRATLALANLDRVGAPTTVAPRSGARDRSTWPSTP